MPLLVLVAAAGAAFLLMGRGKGLSVAVTPEDSSREDENEDDDSGGYSMPGDLTELYDALGWPYWYNRGTPATPWSQGSQGVDCSGFAQVALVRIGLLSSSAPDRSVAGLWAGCTEVPAGEQRPGDLAFYPGHVMVVYGDPDLSGISRVIGASGGGRSTKGDKASARIKLFASQHYRGDFAAFGRLTT